MQILKTLNHSERNSTVDIFRAAAIIAVVLFHFQHTLYIGYLGVDMFFVISGFLVGGLLIKDFKSGKRISFADFFFKRGFKIWPSYYFFLIVTGILGYFIFRYSNPDLIPSDWLKYIYFYKNYSPLGLDNSEWIYAHAWSLCVEEHFYIILPVLFILVQRYGNLKSLIVIIVILILVGNISKFITFYFTESKDTYFTTHNRIDALAWGVLLNILISCSDFVKRYRYKIITFIITLIVFIALIKIYFVSSDFFKIVLFRSVVPVLFTIMIGSLYYIHIPFMRPLSIIGYYSYNWYLWHPIVAIITIKTLGAGITGLIVYLVASFSAAFIFTSIIEEPFLAIRKRLFADRIPGKRFLFDFMLARKPR
jgi:peptidoglycan/LPS O-acetylase OafA/YrhL